MEVIGCLSQAGTSTLFSSAISIMFEQLYEDIRLIVRRDLFGLSIFRTLLGIRRV